MFPFRLRLNGSKSTTLQLMKIKILNIGYTERLMKIEKSCCKLKNHHSTRKKPQSVQGTLQGFKATRPRVKELIDGVQMLFWFWILVAMFAPYLVWVSQLFYNYRKKKKYTGALTIE